MDSLDHKDKEGSVNNLKLHLNHPKENDQSISRQEQSSCSSSLSSSSVESIMLENNENDVATNFESSADNELPTFSQSTNHAYPSPPVWSYQSELTSQNPPSQIMSQPGNDSQIIPLSIFSTSRTNPSAWGHTSNESLFSIQAGNSDDFTKEHFPIGNKCVESDRFDESTRVTFEKTKDSSMVMHCEPVKTLAESSKSVLHETPSVDNSKQAIIDPREEIRISNQSFQSSL